MKVCRLAILAALVFCPFAARLTALDANRLLTQYRQLSWNNQTGLAQSSAQAVAQTADGYIWVGTQEGLARFDGLQFTTFNSHNTPAIRSNFVSQLVSARGGGLWAGTTGGLLYYDGARFRMLTTSDGLISNQVQALLQAKDGSLWIGSPSGLSRYRNGRFQNFASPDAFPGRGVSSLAQDETGAIWIGSENQLVKYDRGAFTVFRFPGRSSELQSVSAIAVDPAGGLVVAIGTQGVFRFRDGAFQALDGRPGAGKPVSSLRFDREGTFWILSYGMGLIRLHDGKASVYNSARGLASNNLLCSLEDNEGNLWIGAEEGGLTELLSLPVVNWGPPEGLPSATIWTVLQDRAGDFLVGAEGSGLTRLHNGRVEAVPLPAPLGSSTILAICQDRDGSVWLGTDSGLLIHLSRGSVRVIRPHLSNQIRNIVQDPDGSLWIGTFRDGLYHYRKGKFDRFTRDDGLFGEAIESMLLDADGSLWVGGLGGLSHITNGAIHTLWTDNELHGTDVAALYQDAARSIWVGTLEGGLHRIDQGRITFYGPADGLFDLTVEAITEDGEGYLWMACNRGVFRVRKEELNSFAAGKIKSIHSEAFNSHDGMRNVEANTGSSPNVWKARDGKLWFATMGGLAVIDPKLSRSPQVPLAPVLLEDVISNESPITGAAGNDLVIPPGRGDLSFSYTVPTFRNPALVSFKYKLEGYDSAWIDAGHDRTVNYTNLAPGSYRFLVRAATVGGRVSELSRPPRLRLEPHLVQQPYFRGLIGVALLAILWTAYQWTVRRRVRKVEARNAALERRIAERTAELRAATLAAEAAAETKSAFLAIMSHEIRTPLNAIIAITGLLADRSRDSEDRDYLHTIQTSGAALLTVVNSILDFSKIESGKLDLFKEPFDLPRCINEAIEMVNTQARAKHLAIRLTLPPHLPPRWIADAARLRQVLLNLLSNAVKFTEAGEIGVRVEVHPSEEDKTFRLTFHIHDTGIGIPADHFGQLFTSFSQIDNRRTRKHGGTGLGLAICRQLVALMGGTISLESVPGKGSTFSFDILAERVDAARDLIAVQTVLGQDSTGRSRQVAQPAPVREMADGVPLKILLVEDNPINQKVAVRLLQRLGYNPDVASNGVEGVSAVEAAHLSAAYDAVITDVQMPEMDGLDATRAIRERIPAHAQPWIIGMTANAFDSARKECLDAGMDDYVSKPFTLERLAEALQRCAAVRSAS